MATNDSALVQHEPAFVLHAVPYRETSLVVELITRSHGRIACVAKGAKRPRSALRAVLLAFQPLRIAYRGRLELRTLTAAEWVGGIAAPQGDALLCGFYLNELLLRLLARDDPHPELFDGYAQALAGLGGGAGVEATLRRFEWLLLREIGYAVDLERDAEQRPIQAAHRYRLQPGQGFWVADSADERSFAGQTLRDMAAGDYDSARTLSEAKRLTRAILSQHLDGTKLKTRQILMDLQKL
ncbi:MAG TPA: DNA repair protein RecO [Burkholderiaceae bacterium]|jgi:DNA repair protein RecO (recombination protein O)|nr:DNA repair protein RecO [Burkholderiaceae bacterium]